MFTKSKQCKKFFKEIDDQEFGNLIQMIQTCIKNCAKDAKEANENAEIYKNVEIINYKLEEKKSLLNESEGKSESKHQLIEEEIKKLSEELNRDKSKAKEKIIKKAKGKSDSDHKPIMSRVKESELIKHSKSKDKKALKKKRSFSGFLKDKFFLKNKSSH